MSKKILLFTLQTFSTTGGIQKMTRTLAHSLNQIARINNWNFKTLSFYDADTDLMPQYLPAKNFKGFATKKTSFAINSLKEAATADIVILSHINLTMVGLAIKVINPKCKIWLIAHGIEVWRPLTLCKKFILNKCDKIICVSNFTKQQITTLHNTNPSHCTVLNNVIDPFMDLPINFVKPAALLKRYNLNAANPVIFTLTRLAATEQYKGHERVIAIIGKLKLKFPTIRYILSGQYDLDEEIRIKKIIAENNVQENVILTGFIDEKEVPDHFLMADLFVLPSKKEGFGIVFIEALACGLPVICGNADGSIDAIRNGELGKAINVDELDDLERAITQSLTTPLTADIRRQLQNNCLHYFNEQDYMHNLEQLITTNTILNNG
jgi:phosphatidylinositol alpha-1,6-mannosyltransferase